VTFSPPCFAKNYKRVIDLDQDHREHYYSEVTHFHFIDHWYTALVYLIVAYFIRGYYRKRHYPAEKRYRTTIPRLWAGIIDQAVLFPSKILLDSASTWLPLYLLALLPIAIDATYSIYLHSRYGQTVGKWICKIKIVDNLTNTRISLNQAMLRDSGLLLGLLYTIAALKGEFDFDSKALTGTAGTIVAIWSLVEIVTMLLNKKRRALHDLIAGTAVVRTNIDEEGAIPQEPPNSIDEALRPPEDKS